jgi:hypothetical protein
MSEAKQPVNPPAAGAMLRAVRFRCDVARDLKKAIQCAALLPRFAGEPSRGQRLRVGREIRRVTWVSGSFVTYVVERNGQTGSTRVGAFIRWARKAATLPPQAEKP